MREEGKGIIRKGIIRKGMRGEALMEGYEGSSVIPMREEVRLLIWLVLH